MRTPEEIRKELGEADAQFLDNGGVTSWPGMSYEEGVSAALLWVLGDTEERPMEDE